MDPLTILLFILIGLVVLLVLLLAVLGVFKKVQYSVKPTYERIEYLLSPAEHAFFTVLLQSVSEKEYVFAKVRVGDLVKVNGMVVESKDWWKYFSAIAQKHVNFVVATRSPVRPLIAIELDDSNHLTTKAKARDTLIESVFAAAGVPLLRIPYSAHGYQVSQIKRQIAELLQAKSTVPPAGRAQVSPAAA